jgi:hypothetical protein
MVRAGVSRDAKFAKSRADTGNKRHNSHTN